MRKRSRWIFLVLLLLGLNASAQLVSPIKWSYVAKDIGRGKVRILLKATIDQGWHIYSVNQVDGGPAKTVFSFAKSKDYMVSGKVLEPRPAKSYDKTFGIDILSFSEVAVFQQVIMARSKKFTVKGSVEFMACNDHECMPPETVSFSVPVSR